MISVSTRPVTLLTGIRQSGKSSLLKSLFPDAAYVTFDHYHHARNAESNPQAFLASFTQKICILDEVQYVPGLFRELKIFVDQDKERERQWILTGSQKFNLLEGARESLAGRVNILDLQTLSARELREANLDTTDLIWKGGFPETWAVKEIVIQDYLDSYISTYLEKDLRQILQVQSLRDFYRLLRSLALRCGALLNYADLAKDVGSSPNTVKSWVSALERSGIITLLEPWFENLSKRLVKAPKVYFNDQGLLCRLLNIGADLVQSDHPLRGNIWENLVFNELIRHLGSDAHRHLFFYRDQNMVEVDFLIEQGRQLVMVEAKAGEKPDLGKVRIPAVSKLVPDRDVLGLVACPLPQPGLFQDGTLKLLNPLLTDFPF